MKTVEDYEQISILLFVERLSIRAIQQQLNYERETIGKALPIDQNLPDPGSKTVQS